MRSAHSRASHADPLPPQLLAAEEQERLLEDLKQAAAAQRRFWTRALCAAACGLAAWSASLVPRAPLAGVPPPCRALHAATAATLLASAHGLWTADSRWGRRTLRWATAAGALLAAAWALVLHAHPSRHTWLPLPPLLLPGMLWAAAAGQLDVAVQALRLGELVYEHGPKTV